MVVDKRTPNIFTVALLTLMVSMYVFPIGFRGLPESLNTKQMLGVFGVIAYAYKMIRESSFSFSKNIIASFAIACLFSLWCFFSVVENDAGDMAYATYFLSFAVWLGGAYGIYTLLKAAYGDVDLAILTKYLTFACLFQCAALLLVDNSPVVMRFVDTWIIQDRVPKELDRLYGIGASLDSGAIRFAFTLLLIAHQIASNPDVYQKKRSLWTYIISFLILTIIGNMMARTTSIGTALGLAYMFFVYGIFRRGELTRTQLRFLWAIGIIISIGAIVSTYLYNHDAVFRSNFRFAFEAFFNYFEQGRFYTSSTDRLNNVMWVWPTDMRGWLIGYGKFESSSWGMFMTDIGYCRFTLYCGLIGLTIFSIYFVYNAYVVSRKFENAKLLSLLLLSMTFIIWVKVSTDIFQLYALLFCISGDAVLDGQDESPSIESE